MMTIARNIYSSAHAVALAQLDANRSCMYLGVIYENVTVLVLDQYVHRRESYDGVCVDLYFSMTVSTAGGINR
jgi:hypothetical protein